MAFKRKNLLSILKKIGAEFTDKIPDERAVEKITRIVGKKGLPEDAEWSESEQKTLKKLKLLKKVAAPAEEKSEKKGKKSKGKKSKGKKSKGKKSKTRGEGNIAKMARLIKEGKSEKEILKIFIADYKEAGKTDKDWMKKRVEIYTKLATGGGKKKSKKDKDEKSKKGNKKKGDTEKSEKKSKGKKKSKEKEEDSDDEEDAD